MRRSTEFHRRTCTDIHIIAQHQQRHTLTTDGHRTDIHQLPHICHLPRGIPATHIAVQRRDIYEMDVPIHTHHLPAVLHVRRNQFLPRHQRYTNTLIRRRQITDT